MISGNFGFLGGHEQNHPAGHGQHDGYRQSSLQAKGATSDQVLPTAIDSFCDQGGRKPLYATDGKAEQVGLGKIPHAVQPRHHPDAPAPQGQEGCKDPEQEDVDQGDGSEVGIRQVEEREDQGVQNHAEPQGQAAGQGHHEIGAAK